MSLKKALHASIRRLDTFINLPYEAKSEENLKKSEARLLLPGTLKLIKLWLTRKDNTQIKYNFAVVIIVKNEAQYLKEWLNYYLSLGVDHFYIYDNGSDDNILEIVDLYKKKVTYTKFLGIAKQMDAYNDALNKYGKACRYMAFLDADEFIYIKDEKKGLFELLEEYFADKNVGGLAINWQIFGSSNLEKKPQGLLTDNFVYRSQTDFIKNRHIKSIISPAKTVGFMNDPHGAYYLPGYYAINEKKEIVNGPFTKSVNTNVIRINHYFTKSKAEFLQKKARGRATKNSQRTKQDFIDHDKNDVFDDSMRIYNHIKNLE